MSMDTVALLSTLLAVVAAVLVIHDRVKRATASPTVKAAQRELDAYAEWCKAHGVREETPEFLRLNAAVNDAIRAEAR